MLQSWSDIDWLDQTLHLLAGFAITFLIGYVLSWWMGVLIAMTVAGLREMAQHPWTCHAGCRTDVLFWLLGSLVAVPILVMI